MRHNKNPGQKGTGAESIWVSKLFRPNARRESIGGHATRRGGLRSTLRSCRNCCALSSPPTKGNEGGRTRHEVNRIRKFKPHLPSPGFSAEPGGI